MADRIGVVAGSFDPITNGHLHIIRKALDANFVDRLYVLVSANPTKFGFIPFETRLELCEQVMVEAGIETKTIVTPLPENMAVATFAKRVGSNIIFRGIRNTTDFEYERQIQLINSRLGVDTSYFLAPRELIEVSSSIIKATFGLNEWSEIAKPFIPQAVFEYLSSIKGGTRQELADVELAPPIRSAPLTFDQPNTIDQLLADYSNGIPIKVSAETYALAEQAVAQKLFTESNYDKLLSFLVEVRDGYLPNIMQYSNDYHDDALDEISKLLNDVENVIDTCNGEQREPPQTPREEMNKVFGKID